MLMLRYMLIMLLSSLLQSGTLTNLEEWEASCQKVQEWKESCQKLEERKESGQKLEESEESCQKLEEWKESCHKLEEWEESCQKLEEWTESCHKLEEWTEPCQLHVMAVSNWHNKLTLGGSPELNQALIVLVNKVNEFSIDGMDEFLNRRLREPLAIAKSNCATLEYNNKDLEQLLSELRAIATEIPSRFRSVIIKVELMDKTLCQTWEEFETSRQKWEEFETFRQKWDELKTSRQKWEEWVNACQLHVKTVSNLHNKLTLNNLSNVADIYEALDALRKKVIEFPIKGMEEIWNHRLEAPLKLSIEICKKLEDKIEYLKSLLSKILPIIKGIDKEFNTFIFEVELELIKKVKWTSESKTELANKFLNLYELSQHNESYFNPQASLWLAEWKEVPQNQKELVDYVETRILDAKLSILEAELPAKIAFFVEQPHIDGDGFLEFSRNFKLEWHKFEQKIDQLKSVVDIKHYRKRLNELAKSAMEETASLKGIIIQNLDQLVTKCHHNDLQKSRFKKLKQLLKSSKKQIKAKNEKVYAMMDIILSDIGIFDGATFNVLVRFEKLDSAKFPCAELETAVEKDKEMVLQAYQVKSLMNELMGCE